MAMCYERKLCLNQFWNNFGNVVSKFKHRRRRWIWRILDTTWSIKSVEMIFRSRKIAMMWLVGESGIGTPFYFSARTSSIHCSWSGLMSSVTLWSDMTAVGLAHEWFGCVVSSSTFSASSTASFSALTQFATTNFFYNDYLMATSR